MRPLLIAVPLCLLAGAAHADGCAKERDLNAAELAWVKQKIAAAEAAFPPAPAGWTRYQVDADNDGVADPNDLNDATVAAANYLCAGGRDLATSGGWWGAVLSYNAIQQYAQTVFDVANGYGQRARTVA